MARTRSLILLTVVLAGLGCTKKSDGDSSDAASPTASASAVASAASVAGPSSVAGPDTTAGPAGGLGASLSERLGREAHSRPSIHPNADEILAAFGKLGAGVVSTRQGLGVTYKASFCEGGTTGDSTLTFSICEYPDDAAGKIGLDALNQVFPAKTAQHFLHKGTVLTSLRLKDTPATQALERKVIAAYQAM